MAKSGRKLYITVAFSLCFVASLFGQELPKMPIDPAIQSGVLPNGTNYYVISNPDTKGMADFALVQKSGRTFPDKVSTSEISESLLTAIPDIDNLSPRRFFVENDVVPRNGRFIETKDGAAIYRFSKVLIAEKPALLDSSLLVLMSMINATRDLEDPFARSCYAPSENAVIVSGDIQSGAVIEKLRMLSYMTPSRNAVERVPYVWSDEKSTFSVFPSTNSTVDIDVVWRFPGAPPAFAGTIQPAVHSKLMNELGIAASDRISHAFRSRNIPFANVGYTHLPSSVTGRDEEFRITAVVGNTQSGEAVRVMAEALSSVKEKGVSLAERRKCHSGFMHNLFDKTRRPVRSDAEYVESCINAFLNGAVPVPGSQMYAFHSSKIVSDSLEISALGRMAAAVMTTDRNMSVRLRTAREFAADSLKALFLSGWSNSDAVEPLAEIQLSDTLRNLAESPKQPLTFIWKEHLSKGSIWTFGNGIRVVYKRMNTGGKLYWALGLNEGYGNIPDLSAGEGAFVGDMFKLGRVAGMTWDDFVSYLEGQEVYMDAAVGLSSTTIQGTAPADGMPMVMRALRAVANEWEADTSAFATYRRNEWLRLERAAGNSNVVVDSLLCPGYKYSRIKTSGKLSDKLLIKASLLFEDMFSKVNDGIFVLIGDKDESIVRKQLRGYLGPFKTSKTVSVNPQISYQPTAGSMTHVSHGDRNAVYMAMSVSMPLTIDNYATAEVAGMILEKNITSALVGSGMHAKVYSDTRIVPHERFSVLVVLEEVAGNDKEGFESTARQIVKKVLGAEGILTITDAQVEACRDWLKHNRLIREKNPQYWIDAVLLRYLMGKDFTRGYEDRMAEVSAAKVRNLLSSFENAGKVEYIIRKK